MKRRGRALFFFFNDTATTEIYTLSLHDALPICAVRQRPVSRGFRRIRKAGAFQSCRRGTAFELGGRTAGDRKSTRLNSSHANISYAVFCLKKKKNSSSTRALTVAMLP